MRNSLLPEHLPEYLIESQQSQQQFQQELSGEEDGDMQSEFEEWLKYREEFLQWKRRKFENNGTEEDGTTIGMINRSPEILAAERNLAIQWQNDLIQSETNFLTTLEGLRNQLQRIQDECAQDEVESMDVGYQQDSINCIGPTRSLGKQVSAKAAQQNAFASNLLKQLQGEFEHEAAMMNDDIDFIREVSTGQEIAPDMNLTQELMHLKKRFETWKEHFKFKLRDARDIIVGHSKLAQHSQVVHIQQQQQQQALQQKKKGLFGSRR